MSGEADDASVQGRGLRGRLVVVGVSGGVAAYKVAGVVSKLRQEGADVRVVMTHNATRFITPLTFSALSGNPVYVDGFAPGQEFAHLWLAKSADVFLIAPATANIIGKMASGVADDLLSTTLLAAGGRVPIIIAPAMNTRMWENPIVQRNVALLRDIGCIFVGPAYGYLAEGERGVGRLAEEDAILTAIRAVVRG